MSKKREQLIATAARLFAAHGYHAVGIDRILAESGVSKVTLYHHFRSKEELILTVLRRRDESYRNAVMRDVEKCTRDPVGRLLALFDGLAQWLTREDFTGCMFINATAEFHRHDDPIHVAAAEHKRLMLQYIVKLAEAAGAAEPERLGRQIYLLMDGAVVQAQVGGGAAATVENARRGAEALLRQALLRFSSDRESNSPPAGEAGRPAAATER
jgi:AcrR family transcriptional regulator